MTRGKDAVLTEPLLGDTLIQEQIDLEARAIRDGVKRYRDMAKAAVERGQGASLKPVERLLAHWFHTLSILIHDEMKACEKGEWGQNRACYGPIIRSLKPDDLAVIVMQEAANHCVACPSGVPFTRVAYSVGRGVLAEIELRTMKKHKRDAYEELRRKYKKADDLHIRRWWKGLSGAPGADRRAITMTGAALIEILVKAASCGDYFEDLFDPAFEVYKHKTTRKVKGKTKPNQQWLLRLTPAALAIIDDGHRARQAVRPRYLPMIVKPYRWSKDAQGGYVRIRTPLVAKPTHSQKALIARADMERVYDAIGAASGVRWRIRQSNLERARAIWDSGGGELRVPAVNDIERPPHPGKDDAEKLKAWKREAVRVHRENLALLSDRCDWIRTLQLAEEYALRPQFYLPHMLDFRGRMYPIPTHLNHHGDDLVRGMLEFAEPVDARGSDAQFWLRVHTANCYGIDKVPFDDRVKWVETHRKEIAQSLSDPLNDPWWKNAEKPWQFLAACEALVDDEAAAHLPVQIDGTCNGTQHYVAIGRDAGGAAFVNMVPADRPGDLYSAVLDVARQAVAVDCIAGKAMASVVQPLMDRKVVKQTVMTIVYGVTWIGARGQIQDRLKEHGLRDKQLYDASSYLTGVVLNSIGQLCESATAAMRWLADCAKLIASEGRLVGWTTPVGFPAEQRYRKFNSSSINTGIRSLTLMVPDERMPVWVKKQVQGIAPNYIHSIDSSHLMMVQSRAEVEGLSVASIHDAHWTHAATTGRLGTIIREEFVRLHEVPLLEVLAEEWSRKHRDIDFPATPTPGIYDIGSVLGSRYFFS